MTRKCQILATKMLASAEILRNLNFVHHISKHYVKSLIYTSVFACTMFLAKVMPGWSNPPTPLPRVVQRGKKAMYL